MPATSPTTSPRESGFALYELVLALAILGLVAGIAAPRVARPPGAADLRVQAQAIAGLLRADRNVALRRQVETVTRIDVEAATITSGVSGRRVHIPSGIKLALLQSSLEQRAEGGGIRFRPDGHSSGGFLSLERGVSAYTISVNWLTGAVLVAAASPGALEAAR
jgi:general secretion pathway protein H